MSSPFAQPPVQPGLRAGDRDRDAVAERLGDALADGALSAAEYQSRLDRALAAVTQDELAALTADLPESRTAGARAAAVAASTRRAADRLRWRKEILYWVGGAVIMTVLWAAKSISQGHLEDYWPAWPLGIWGAILLSYVFWPARDKKNRGGTNRHENR
ncbi:DUF1707 SHOCT-like domain-containing protein [Actinomadura oligospora]|uniref:DUF1707 SHOCT-like domain-containing protein n=1 Tax=Actinomadura oligospora TaxID=111804 RepID=UPI0004BB3137|nr:DUF1707 domain-containing protein [Actinomadura oligospora]